VDIARSVSCELDLAQHTNVRFGYRATFASTLFLLAFFLTLSLSINADTERDYRPFLAQDKHRILEVKDVVEAEDGAIWVATWGNGIHRIYRTDWRNYTESEDGVPDWAYGLAVSRDNRVWCGTGEGLYLFEGDDVSEVAPESAPGLKDVSVREVISMQDGRVVVSTSEGTVFTCTPVDRESALEGWSRIGTLEDLQGSRASSLLDGPGGELWVGTERTGIFRYDGVAWHPMWVRGNGANLWRSEGAGRSTIRATAYLGSEVSQLTDGIWEPIGAAGDSVLSLASDENEDLYIGTPSGLRVLSKGAWQDVELPAEFGSPIVEALLFDRRGSLWVGTRQGLVRGAWKTWQGNIRTDDGIPLTRLVRGGEPGQPLWAVDKQWRLCRQDLDAWRPVVQLADRGRPRVGLWRFPGDDFLWVEQQDTLRRYSVADGSVVGEWPVPEGGRARNLFKTSDGKILVLHDAGAFEFRDGDWVPFPDVEGYEHKDVFELVEVEPGRFVAAVEEGAEVWTADKVTELVFPRADDVVSVDVGSDGSVWLGSFGQGLMRMNPDLTVDASFSRDIYSKLVAKVFEDSRGCLWVSFRRGGVASFQDGRWNNYTYAHGLPNVDTDSIQEDAQGDLWLSTNGAGVYHFQPDTDEPETQIKTGGRSVASHGIASFTFSGWDAWNHTPGSLLTYSWRILAHPGGQVVSPWSPYSSETVALTSSLAPGSYQVEVRTADENRNVDPTPAQREFEVQLPFWRKPAFLLPLFTIGLIAVVASIIAQRSLMRRMRAEKTLRESEERLTLALHGADLGLWDWNVTTGETTYNERWAEMVGYSRSEIGPGFDDWKSLIHPEDLQRVEQLLAAHLEGRTDSYEAEYRLKHKSGEWIWVLDRGGVISRDKENKPLRACGTHLDVTERKRGEREIARIRRYLQNVFDSMPSTLIGVDGDGIVTQWNLEAERVTGLSAAEAEGCHFRTVFPTLGPVSNRVHEALLSGEPNHVERLSSLNEEGETVHYDVVVYPLTTNGVTGAVIRVDEVTARVAIEEMMVQTEKMLSVGGLAAGMAHEINNPLGGILQACQNIERRTSPDLRKNQDVAKALGLDMETLRQYMNERGILDFIQGIRADGARAASIVADMLAFSRQSESHLAPHRAVDMIETVLRLAANDYDLKKHYDFRRVVVTRDHEDEDLVIRCDKTKIEQVLLNLVKNATQAMAMAEDNAEPAIRITTRVEEKFARIEVADNGPGMDEKVRRRVFEPFFTTKEVGVGTGLGLSVSYFIITQQHKGTMSVESTPGRGTCFTIRVPLVTDESKQ